MTTPDDLQQLALRLSAFADVLNRHATTLVHQADQSTQALHDTVRLFSTQTRQMSQELAQAVSAQAREAIERGAGDGMRKSGEQLQQATRQTQLAAHALGQELQSLRSAQRSLVWKSGLALLVGALLAAGGSGYLAWRSHKTLQAAEFPTQLLEATRTGALTPCGDRLCARISRKPKRFGAHGEYAEIR